MRIINLKFFGVIAFILLFFVGGFFINTAKSEASSTVESFGVYYSLSPVVSITNSDGSTTTKIYVGCAPQSGDRYDINTGKPCTNNIKTVFPGCKIGSGHVFDVNTGIRCDSYIKSVIIGCAPLSGHVYDINTGQLCKNKTSIPVVEKTKVEIPKISILNPVTQVAEISPATNEPIEEIQKEEDGDELSGREVLMSSISANAGKVGKVFKGPMIFWIILILIIVLLGGGYGIYSLLKKDKENKEVKKVEPIVPVNKAPVQETLPMNNNIKENPVKPNIPEASIPNTQPHTQPNTQQTNPPVSNGTGSNIAK